MSAWEHDDERDEIPTAAAAIVVAMVRGADRAP